MSVPREIVIVGAGAAGLWAAGRAAAAGSDVLLLEKTSRTGTKILASGGGRCNLTTTLDAERTRRCFGGAGDRFLRAALRTLPPLAVRRRFDELGIATEEAPLEKVFPAAGNARVVRDALESAALAAGVELRLEAPVREVVAETEFFRVVLEGGEAIAARKLLLSPGGRSYPSTGTTGDGYGWLESLGLEVVPPVPALTPLVSAAEWVRELSGVSLQDTEVRLLDRDGQELGRRRRPLLFTHRGLSGPAAMDLSGIVARRRRPGSSGGAPEEGFTLAIDLCPDLSREELRTRLIEAARRTGGGALGRVLPGAVPRRVLEVACARAGSSSAPQLAHLSRAQRHGLVEGLKGLRVPIDGTLGFEAAEVTRGGLALGELDPRTMGVNRIPGLYVFGELVDLDGPIGGFNFQAAFATAELAARAAVEENTR